MYSRTLDCVFDAIFDPSNDEWIAIQVYRDGNPIELCRFDTENEAFDHAKDEMKRQLVDNGQFGMGA